MLSMKYQCKMCGCRCALVQGSVLQGGADANVSQDMQVRVEQGKPAVNVHHACCLAATAYLPHKQMRAANMLTELTS